MPRHHPVGPDGRALRGLNSRPLVPDPQKLHRGATRLTSVLLVVLGLLLVVSTLARGGGPLAVGLLLVLLLAGAGAARLYLAREG